MRSYLELLHDVRQNGKLKAQRATLESTGTKPRILSCFGRQWRHDLATGFPLLTTKRMPWAPIVHELLWFISGSTNIRYLKSRNVRIWDQWADAEGELGPVYGKQWRSFEGPQGPVDQLGKLIADIKKVTANPWASEARRLVMTAWHPANMPDPKVPTGCHTLCQFNVTDDRLSCLLYMRSADLFLGVPFNIASYALLTHLIAKITSLDVGELIVSFGDVHIYENHFPQVDEQLKREPLALPKLTVSDAMLRVCRPVATTGEPIGPIDVATYDDFLLDGYMSHATLRGEVAV